MKKAFRVIAIAIVLCIVFSQAAFAVDEVGTADGATAYPTVNFYIAKDGVIKDSAGNIKPQPVAQFSKVVYKTTLTENSATSIAIGDSITEADVLEKVAVAPTDAEVFEALKAQNCTIVSLTTGKDITPDQLNTTDYSILWYVFKSEYDGYHVDGVVVSNENIFVGGGGTVPSTGATRHVVQYDIATGTYLAGTMQTKPHTPIGVRCNYEVFDEGTFVPNGEVVTQREIDVCNSLRDITNLVFEMREGEIVESRYGRVDSEAFQYALEISPYVVPYLESKGMGVDTYDMWLVWGDRAGGVTTVWVAVD